MTIEEILKLGEMGFTKDDIMKFDRENKHAEPEPEKEEEKSEPEKKDEEQKPEKKESSSLESEKYDLLNNTINELIKTIQAGNIIKSNNKIEPKQAPEEVLASIIAPPEKQKGR